MENVLMQTNSITADKINQFIVKYYRLHRKYPDSIRLNYNSYMKLRSEVRLMLRKTGQITKGFVSITHWNGIPVQVVVDATHLDADMAWQKQYHIRKRKKNNGRSKIRK